MHDFIVNIDRYLQGAPLLALAAAFAAGLLTSFTPCVYPLIPVTVAVIGARSAGTKTRALYLSIVYVMGLAAVYSGLGAFAALSAGAKGQEKAEKKSGKRAGKAAEEKDSAKIEQGTVEKRPVTVGYTRTDYSQIDAGLTEGEIVVMTGFERLEDGKKIRLIETQEAEL